jgi:hypothetical protein
MRGLVRSYVTLAIMALQTTDIARQWLISDHVRTPTDADATMLQQSRNDVFCADRAEMLFVGRVNKPSQSVELVIEE